MNGNTHQPEGRQRTESDHSDQPDIRPIKPKTDRKISSRNQCLTIR